MCGICGIVDVYRDGQVDPGVLIQMRDSMLHRGPDDAGVHVSPGVGLASRRLAILDLSPRGHMPMVSDDRRYVIVYNGEIYNYRELRAPLAARGVRFQSGTDTEVLLRLFEADGPAMLEQLNGMFAFAIWDTVARRLFAARDRLGVKPLFYAEHQGRLYFASEEKALFAAGIPMQFDHEVWPELLCFRYVAGDRTPFKGVKRLLPGHSLQWHEGRLELRRWWNLADRARARRELPMRDPVEWYRRTFDDSVRLRTISDVPVGVLLSGGLDSSSVAASLARQTNEQVASFTVRFADSGYDEGPLAEMVARDHGLTSHQVELTEQQLLPAVRCAAAFNDEPLAHGNDAHLLAISRHAKPRVTVLLSGEGADETLGGYVRYRPLRHPALLHMARPALRTLRPLLRRNARWHKLARFLQMSTVRDFVLYNACDTLPSDLAGLGLKTAERPAYRDRVLDEAEALYPRDRMRQAMYSDQHTFLCSLLDRNDRMTMGASIECRVPFLDYRLVEGLAALPSSQLLAGEGNKPLLRRSLGDRLPDDVLRHPKWGFGVPWRKYLRTIPELRSLVLSLARHPLLLDSPIDTGRLTRRVAAFDGGDDEHCPLVLQLLLATQAWDASRTATRLSA